MATAGLFTAGGAEGSLIPRLTDHHVVMLRAGPICFLVHTIGSKMAWWKTLEFIDDMGVGVSYFS